MPGHIGIPYADCYRCPLGLTYPQCGLGCIEVGRTIVKHQSVGAIAAVVVEPMLGTAGNVIPPDGFLPALKELAKEWDALFIADEMITGLGRTGRVWGTMHSGVVPDIVTVGKGLGGGLPLSALLARRDIAQATPWAQPSGSSSSYGGNPLAAAAGDAALKAIAEEHLIENSARQGEFARNILLRWLDQFPFVGDVRGRGLFLGMDLVRDRTTKEPLSAASTARIFQACVQRGLLAMTYTSRVRLQPALTIDQDTLSHGLGLLEEVFEETLREGFWRDP
jgi:4-aminobutyrate aminotransferase-like enzyme